MGKFNFSRPGRKKPVVPQLAITEPSMSKAHKVLGSTPLSIDSPLGLDDTHSPTLGTGDRVRIPAAERQWGHEQDHSPSSLRFNAMGDGMAYGAMALKKAQSSPTIKSSSEKSWPDQSKQPHSVSRQTSMPVTTKGLPSKAQRILDADNALDPSKMRKKPSKPSKLDFSNIVSASRLSRKESPVYLNPSGAHNPSNASKSPSILSPFSSASGRPGDMRKMLKQRTKEGLRSLFPDSSPVSSESPQREGHSDNGLSTLYDHYEQMTFRQIAQQDFKSEDSPENTQAPIDSQDEIEWRAAEVDHDLDWVHKTLASAPPTAMMYSSSPGARSISSRYTRTSKASKQTNRSLQEADFQEKSVLMLSSDSEDDVELAASIRSRPPVPTRGSSDLDRGLTPHEKHQSKTSRTRRSPDSRSSRQSNKRASFAPSNTYITIPNVEDNRSGPARSRSKSPRGETPRAPSPRESLNSNISTGSGLTCQIGYGIQETQAFTVLPARRRSLSGLEQETTPLRSSVSSRHASPYKSPNQITPPMSPSSMHSYMQSARSSIDGSGGQNRIMALTRQEEMLISAIRKKTQDMRDNARLESNRQSLAESRSEARGSDASQITMTETSVFDFDFPVPPKFDKKKQRQSAANATLAKRNSLAAKNEAYSQSDDDSYLSSSFRPSDAASQKDFLENDSQGSQESAEQQDVPVYVDDEGSPISYEEDESGLDESIGIATDFLFPVSRRHSEEGPATTERKGNISLKARPHSERLQTGRVSPTPGGLATVSEDKVDDVEDTPRPDSPIAPDSFPPVPHRRTTISNMARLSAVGCARRDPEPGWWGDDD